jgi:2-methylcitrate dehydratase PrpD
MSDYLDALADFACRTTLDDVEPRALQHLRHILADTLAACAIGNQEAPMRHMLALQQAQVAGGLASVLGTAAQLNPLDAAALNASAGCWLELDEGNLPSNGHPGIQVLPTALAVAQQRGRSGAEFLLACAIGYEVVARIGSACDMRMSIHPHGTYGVVGAAVAAGRLMGLERAQMRELISLAASSPIAGNRQGMKEGATLRNWYAAHSATMGQTAVRLVQSGFTGPIDGLRPTCDDVLFDNFRPDALVRDLGRRWLLAEGYIKLYGCGRPIHAALDALLDALAPLGGPAAWPAVEEVERIGLRGFKFLVFLGRTDIRNAFATRFSTPFALASVLAHRSHGIECFTDAAAADARIQALMQRVSMQEDAAFSERFPAQQCCDLTLTLKDGRQLQGRCEVIRGEPANPADPQDYRDKFMALGARVWPEHQLEALYQQALYPERLQSLQGWGLVDSAVKQSDVPGGCSP